jgi:hypothetical protein
MRSVNLEELRKGDLILVRWVDASDVRAPLREHEARPEIHVKDWGVYLGVVGRKHRFLLLGKDVDEVHNEWGATRIPLELVVDIVLILPREKVSEAIKEILTLTRRVRLRRYRLRNAERIRIV